VTVIAGNFKLPVQQLELPLRVRLGGLRGSRGSLPLFYVTVSESAARNHDVLVPVTVS
jgi:hypothetical protein